MTKEDLRRLYFKAQNKDYKAYFSPDERIDYLDWLEDEYCKLEVNNLLLQCENKASKDYIKDIMRLKSN